jgi:uncharacterized membrane protein
MTSSISTNPLGYTGINFYQNPPIVNAYRAPTVNDIYIIGTRWTDNSVVPPVIYTTTGNGVWNSSSAASFTSLTVTGQSTLAATNIVGTTNINTSGAAVSTLGTGGTGAVNIGNATGNTTVTGSITASGNIIINGAATQLRVHGGAVTDFIGSATLAAGTVTIANTNIAATDRIFIQRSSANASVTLGELTYTISAATSFTITSVILGTPASPQTADVSIVSYFIVRQV